ncbi:MAG: hypothetical protein K0R61_742 [Microvirga sp.]|jgi:hypothetical protein|nr:hypothetical protein [Microvirga sp.]MCD6070999.1 hypothetical protein [Microvirga sp.]MDF2970292.1 hypothetical protein [Microvirga sp.]
MVAIRKIAAPEAPDKWVLDGRWAGGSLNMHDHECDRAMWHTVHWATPRVPAPKFARPEQILKAAQGVLPPRQTGVAADFLCPTCPHWATCYGLQDPARNCRTCAHVKGEGRWFCTLHGDEIELDLQRVGCGAWRAF